MGETTPNMYEGPRITVIGGGTGNFTVLTGLKPLVGDGLTAVVNMVDDGGSTGILRDQYGVLPAGDARQCLVALSNAEQDVRDLFNQRLGEDDGYGAAHNVGNMLFVAAEHLKGDYAGALKLLSRFLSITGQVLPVTNDNRRLKLTTLDGVVIIGEHQAELNDIQSLEGATVGFNKDSTEINPEAEAAIKQSELVVIAPGDLYTSIAPALAVRGMKESLNGVPVIHLSNLMNRDRHTVGFDVSKHSCEIERIIGAQVLSAVLYNTTLPSKALVDRYLKKDEKLVQADLAKLGSAHYEAVGRDLISSKVASVDSKDIIGNTRSLIRHDPVKLARAIMSIYYGS